MPLADWLHKPLHNGAVYAYHGTLFEAVATPATWQLLILNEDGEPLAPSQGLLFGFELDLNLEGWYRLHYMTMPSLWPAWHYMHNGLVEIDPAHLRYVADSRARLLTSQCDERETFREVMAEIEFEWNE